MAAARGRDAGGYFSELAASHVLDGLSRYIERKWPKADPEMVYEVVTFAADRLYEASSDGGAPENAIGYMCVVARNRMLKLYRMLQRQTDAIPDLEAPSAITESEGESAEHSLGEALRIARELIPRLGQASVQAVMTVVFDAIERGDEYIENERIAAITGLTLESVRRSKNRGWERLRREARKAGLVLPEELKAGADDEGEEGDPE
mgnify:CR=1 FL=1